MNDLVQKLISQANLGEQQAKKVVDIVANYLGDKLPPAIATQVKAALTSDVAVNEATKLADQGLQQLGGMLGGGKKPQGK